MHQETVMAIEELHPTDIRETMREGLPACLQPTLTWLSGRPYRGQRPLWQKTPLSHLLIALLLLFGGATLSAVVFSTGPVAWPLLCATWCCTVGGARTLQVAILHQCVHFRFSGNRTLDRWLGEAVSIVITASPFQVFYRDHVVKHHGKAFATRHDPDCKFLLELGFKPGMSVPSLWKQLRRTLVSPRFHCTFLVARLRANFQSGIGRGILATIPPAIVVTLGLISGSWTTLAVAWAIPLTFGYHVAALLNFCSLHSWLAKTPNVSGRQAMVGLSIGRFIGEAAPVGESRASWGRWWVRLLIVHLPVRLAVLVSDLPVHDYHHRHPSCSNWADYLYTRQRDLERGCPDWPELYHEVWGLTPAIHRVFESLSTASLVDTDDTTSRVHGRFTGM